MYFYKGIGIGKAGSPANRQVPECPVIGAIPPHFPNYYIMLK